MFDYEGKVISVATKTGEVRVLASYPVIQSGPGRGWPEKLIESSPRTFAHDVRSNRLLFMICPPTELISVNLSDLSRTVILDTEELEIPLERKCGSSPAFGLKGRRVYYSDGDQIWSRSFEGTLRARFKTTPLGAKNMMLSTDERMLVAQKYKKVGRSFQHALGCWVLDADSLTVKTELSQGHSFRWSSKGDHLAFLIRSEELWIYRLADRSLTKVAWVKPLPNAPKWSRARYFSPPVWSDDDRMLACSLATWRSGYHQYDYVTVLLDFETKQCRPIPAYWGSLSWSPIPHPFTTLKGR